MYTAGTQRVCVSYTEALFATVPASKPVAMTALQDWMEKNDKRDADVARAVKRSRPQISRIRRGKNGASQKTALRLETLTGIRWWKFIGPSPIKRRG